MPKITLEKIDKVRNADGTLAEQVIHARLPDGSKVRRNLGTTTEYTEANLEELDTAVKNWANNNPEELRTTEELVLGRDVDV